MSYDFSGSRAEFDAVLNGSRAERRVGVRVLFNGGYPGTITRVCEWSDSLVEVRGHRGTVCIAICDCVPASLTMEPTDAERAEHEAQVLIDEQRHSEILMRLRAGNGKMRNRKTKYDFHIINDGLAVVFTIDEHGQQNEEIASAAPIWAERIADALNYEYEGWGNWK